VVRVTLPFSLPKHEKVKIKEAFFYSTYYELLIPKHSGMARVNEEGSGTHSFTHTFIHKWNEVEPYLPVTPSRIVSPAALWLVLISRSAKGRRLSWPRWLGEILWFARPKTVTHYSIYLSGWELNPRPSSRESNALTTRLRIHLKVNIDC